MKKVMLVALIGMFSVALLAQTQEKARPVEKKKEPAKTEQTSHMASASAKEAKPVTKETAKPAKHKTSHATKSETKSETKKGHTPKM